jgi:hypothetical protein
MKDYNDRLFLPSIHGVAIAMMTKILKGESSVFQLYLIIQAIGIPACLPVIQKDKFVIKFKRQAFLPKRNANLISSFDHRALVNVIAINLHFRIFDLFELSLKVTVKLCQRHTTIPSCHIAFYL